MAILTRVASAVRTVVATQSDFTTVLMGEAGAAGQAYRIDPSDNKAYLSDGNMGNAISAKFAGYLLGNAAIGQKVQAQIGGQIYLGDIAIQGKFYFVSGTPGETEDSSAQISGMAGQLIGYGMDDGSIKIDSVSSGWVIPS